MSITKSISCLLIGLLLLTSPVQAAKQANSFNIDLGSKDFTPPPGTHVVQKDQDKHYLCDEHEFVCVLLGATALATFLYLSTSDHDHGGVSCGGLGC